MKETMKAFVWEGNGKYGLKDVPTPKMQKQTDVIGRVTVNAICTSDVHILAGKIPTVKCPNILGHEFCIEVIEVGSKVKNVKVGDHALSAPAACCLQCECCKSGHRIDCQNGGAFGLSNLEGAQAEYIRIPLADKTLVKIPEGRKDEDYLLASDMLATGYFGIKNAEVQPGQIIAVVGLGPVGFSTCTLLKKMFGATVIAITRKQKSLDIALNNGIADYTIKSDTEDINAKISEITKGKGVDSVIETAGTEKTMTLSCEIVKKDGIVSTVSVFGSPITLPFNKIYLNNVQIKTGVQNCKGIGEIFQAITEGKIDTNFMLTHKSPLNDILKAYDIFGKKADGCIKWVITPYEYNK